MKEEFWRKYSQLKTLQIDPDTINKYTEPRIVNVQVVDNRMLNVIDRLAETIATAHRDTEVLPHHMEWAIKLIQFSIASRMPEFPQSDEDLSPEERKRRLKEEHDKANKEVATGFVKYTNRRTQKKFDMMQREEIRLVKRNISRFAEVVHKASFDKCQICHGEGIMSDPANEGLKGRDAKHEDCDACEGRGGEYGRFMYLSDVEAPMINGKAITKKDCRELFELCKKKKWIERTGEGYTPKLDLKSPDLIDRIFDALNKEREEIENYTDKVPEEDDVKVIKPRGLPGDPVPATSLDRHYAEQADKELENL